MYRYQVITTTGAIYFTWQNSLGEAWEWWYNSYGRVAVAECLFEKK